MYINCFKFVTLIKPYTFYIITVLHLPGKLIATFSPLRSLIFRDKVLKRGCPGNIASSGKKSDLVAPSFGVALAGGSAKPSQPNLKHNDNAVYWYRLYS